MIVTICVSKKKCYYMFVKQKHVISRHRGKPEKEDTYTRKKKALLNQF